MVTVRRAVYNDIPGIMRFIDEHWKKDHILAINREFFEWQFCYNNQVNMIIGIDDNINKIYGIQGFILYNQSNWPDVAGSIWKTIKSDNPMLGVELEEKVKEVTSFRWCSSPGLSKRAIKLGVLRGATEDRLGHYYRLGYVDDFKIAKISQIERGTYQVWEDVELREINSIEEFKQIFSQEYLSSFLPYKDQDYFDWRYFKHPIYKYQMYGIQLEDKTIRAAFICRKVEQEGRYAIKIVDFIGMERDFSKVGRLVDELLHEKGIEYIDCYCYGLRMQTMQEAGFTYRDVNHTNIIPNYFEPFVQENVEIGILLPWGEFRMFRGDGDQDRPSKV